jgi:hypothetical protein
LEFHDGIRSLLRFRIEYYAWKDRVALEGKRRIQLIYFKKALVFCFMFSGIPPHHFFGLGFLYKARIALSLKDDNGCAKGSRLT